MALGSLVGRGFVRIDADTAPAKKAILALGALGSQGGLLAVGGLVASSIGPATTAVMGLASSFALAGGAATVFTAAVVPQFKAMSEASQKQKTAEDAETAATLAKRDAQRLAKEGGFKYGEQIKITSGMSAQAKATAEEYNAALSTAESSTKAAAKSQALYKEKLAAMPPATRTTAQAMESLKDSVKKWSDALAVNTMPIFTRGIQFLQGLLPKLTPIVRSVSSEITTFMDLMGESTAGKIFKQFGKNIQTNGAGALGSFLRTATNVIAGIVGLFNAFLPASKGVTGGLEEMTEKFARWSAGLSKSESFKKFTDSLKTAGPGLVKTLGDILKVVVTVVQAMGPLAGISLKVAQAFAAMLAALPASVLKTLAQVLVITNVAMKLYALYTAAATAATWAFSTANGASRASMLLLRIGMAAYWIQLRLMTVWTAITTAATYALGVAMAVVTSPIGIVVLAVIALAAGFVIAWKKSETFRNIVKGAMDGVVTAGKAVGKFFSGPFVRFFTETIPNAFKATLDWVKKNWPYLVGALGGPVGVAVVWIVKHWDTVTSALGKALDTVIDFFKKLPGRIVSALGNLGKLLYDKGRDILIGLWNGAKAAWAFMSRWVAGLAAANVRVIGNLARTLYQKGRDIITGLWNGAKNLWEAVSNWVRQRPGAFRDRMGELGRTLYQKGRDIITGLWNGAKALWNTVTSWLRGRASASRSAVGNAAGYLIGKGRDIISGLWNGLKDRWNDAISWIKGLKDKVVKAIVSAFGIGSPARAMIPLGVHIMSGLMKGMLSSQKVLKSAVKKIFHSVTDVFKRGGSLLGDLVGGLGSAIGLGDASAAGGAQHYAQLYMKTLGFGPSQWPALKALWQGESGWNPRAHNASSGAHGIPQSLPASKMRSEGADYLTNAATQIRWGLKYIKSRYGSPSAAYSAWLRRSPHWYDSGGLARQSGLIAKLTNQPERVLSPRQTAAFEKLVPALTQSGSGSHGITIVIEKLVLENNGVIGSRNEVENWLVSSFETLQRQGRIRAVTR